MTKDSLRTIAEKMLKDDTNPMTQTIKRQAEAAKVQAVDLMAASLAEGGGKIGAGGIQASNAARRRREGGGGRQTNYTGYGYDNR